MESKSVKKSCYFFPAGKYKRTSIMETGIHVLSLCLESTSSLPHFIEIHYATLCISHNNILSAHGFNEFLLVCLLLLTSFQLKRNRAK